MKSKSKSIFFALRILGLIPSLLIAGCAFSVRPTIDPSELLDPARLLPSIKEVLQNGDWLVIRGFHKPDNMVAVLTNAPLSHAAIYDEAQDQVIEADAAGVHTATLNEFLAKAQRVMVLRPMWASPPNRVQAVARTVGWLGRPYNYSGLIGLNVPESFYCSQLAIKAYEPFWGDRPKNPIPRVVAPGQLYHWATIIYDSGP